MNKSFISEVQEVFRKHGIEDEKLELAIAELFDSYKDFLLSMSSRFVDDLTEKQERAENRRNKFR